MEDSKELMNALEYLVITSEGDGEAVARAYRTLRDAIENSVPSSEVAEKENRIEKSVRLIKGLVEETDAIWYELNHTNETPFPRADRLLETQGCCDLGDFKPLGSRTPSHVRPVLEKLVQDLEAEFFGDAQKKGKVEVATESEILGGHGA